MLASPSLVIHIGDITDFKADIIVTTTSVNGFARRQFEFGINAALIQKAGVGLKIACQQVCQNSPALNPGDVLETPGCSLNCTTVYHVLLEKYDGSNDNLLKNCVQECLITAEKRKCSSIAFPVIGTGAMRYPADVVAQIFKDLFCSFKGCFLKEIDIVLYPFDVLNSNVFSKVFNVTSFPATISCQEKESGHSQPRKRFKRSTKSSRFDLEVVQGDLLDTTCEAIVNPVSPEFALNGSPLSSKILSKAGLSIAAECSNNPLHQSAFYRVTGGGNMNCKYIIHTASPTVVSELETVFDVILSLTENDLQVQSLAIPAIATGNAGLSCAEVAKAMAAALTTFKNSKALYLHKIQVVIFDPAMLSEFKNALGDLLDAKTTPFSSSPKLKRKTPAGKKKAPRKSKSSLDDLPTIWEGMGGEQLKTVRLSPSTKEYQQVLGKFLISNPTIHVLKIERIQNPFLYKQFQAQMAKTEAHLNRLNVTKELFHGTKGDVCSHICKEGFDRSHSGENGRYGRGAYFAATSHYSHHFAVPNELGVRHMFLADVVIGDCCLGDPSYKVPPLKPNSTTDRFDSVVDALPVSNIFVTFKDASAYPLYLLTYV